MISNSFEVFTHFRKQARRRLTRTRMNLARRLLAVKGVFSVEDVEDWVEEAGLPIGGRSIKATVELLELSGLVKIVRRNSPAYYVSLPAAQEMTAGTPAVCKKCFRIESLTPSRLVGGKTEGSQGERRRGSSVCRKPRIQNCA